MTLPATATGRWLTTSLIHAITAIAPTFPLHLGPLFAAPAAIPAVIVEPQTHTWTPVLGQRISDISNQRGGVLAITHRLLLLSAPATGDLAPAEYLANLRVPLMAGPIPWLTEVTPGTLEQVGTLALRWDDAPQTLPSVSATWLAALHCASAQAWITVTGVLHWPEGATP